MGLSSSTITMAKEKPAYVVFRGHSPGVYENWKVCRKQAIGYANPSIRKFNSNLEAEQAWAAYMAELAHPIAKPVPILYPILPSSPPANSPPIQYLNLKRPRAKPVVIIIDDDDDDDDYEPMPKRRQVEEDVPVMEVPVVEELFKEGEAVILTPDQEAMVTMALQGRNIFLTGAGGCGKTVTLRHLLARFKERKITSQVVAPTGIAALPLGGKTAYSYLGWKPESLHLPLDKLKAAPKPYVKKVVRATQVLIVEEISMVENQFLERMNLVIQEIMDDKRPFGGKQVIFLGDFHQLPPVKPFETCLQCGLLMTKETPFKCEKCSRSFVEADKWAFKAPVWKKLKLQNVQLQRIHRQKDERFQDMLNKIRHGIPLTGDEWADLEANRPLPRGACAVRLMSLRRMVDDVNRKELAAIKFRAESWPAFDGYSMIRQEQDWLRPWEIENPLKNHRFPEVLHLKVGAKVVLLTNLDQEAGLVNGAQGRIIGYEKREHPNGSSDPFYTEVEDPKKPPVFKAVLAPKVLFANGCTRTIDPVESTSQHGTNEAPYRAVRVQIPLSLAWALTIHKSQGMTLQYVEVSKKDLFEPGQLYVALSRATNLDGLTVSGFSREQLPVDETVLEFYRKSKWITLPSMIS